MPTAIRMNPGDAFALRQHAQSKKSSLREHPAAKFDIMKWLGERAVLHQSVIMKGVESRSPEGELIP